MKLLPLAVLFTAVLVVACPLTAQPIRPAAQAPQTANQPLDLSKADTDALQSANLSAADPTGLLAYLRQRTLSDTDLTQIQSVIRRMGEERFEERLRASEEILKFGPAAIAPLRIAAESDPDPEVAYRAEETLRRMEKVPHAAVALAAIRALAKSKPTEAPQVLLGYLPLADTIVVEDEIRSALAGMAVRNGQADPALLSALKDPLPIRRGAAAVALIEGGANKGSILIPEAFSQLKSAAAAETDPETKFRMVFALLTAARDKEAVAELIRLIPLVQRGRLWQIEDYLVQLAGNNSPTIRLGTGKAALEKNRDEWLAWWNDAKESTRLDTFDYRPKTTGRLLLISSSVQGGFGNTRISELGPDLKERWTIRGLNYPADCQVLPNGRVLVMLQNPSQLTERDQSGQILVTRILPGPPVGFQQLENGHTLIAFRHMVAEFDTDWNQTLLYGRNQADILAAYRLANGETLVLCQNPSSIIRLDVQGKELPNAAVRIGQPAPQAQMHVLSDDRVLVAERNRVVEYDLRSPDKKEVWTIPANNPTSIQRLSNGNTLIAETNNNVREIAPDGEVVWSYSPLDGTRVMRAERR